MLVLHGAILLGLLVTFRANLAASDFSTFDGWASPALWRRFLPDLGLVLLTESLFWCLGVTLFRARFRAWLVLVSVAHLFFSVAELCAEQYYRMSGQRLSPQFAFFYLAHPPGRTGEILKTNSDPSFLLRVVAFVAALLLGAILLRTNRLPRWRAPRWVPFLSLLIGATVLAAPKEPESRTNKIGVSLLGSFLAGLRPDFGETPALVPNIVRYAPPKVTGKAPIGAPNIILVVLESTRFDLIHPLDPKEPPTMPFLAQLAEKGLDIDHVAVAVSHTSKALVTVHCGMWPELVMPIWASLDGYHPLTCLPELLGAAGYHTAFWQSAYGKFEERAGLIKNFGYSEQTLAEALVNPRFQETGYIGIDEFAMLDPVTKWIANRQEPFFVGMLTSSTHHPYQGPGVSNDDTPALRWPNYKAAARHVDRFIEALVTRLEALHALDNTILVFIGDHGESFGDWDHPGFGGHDACPYDQCMHVPLIMYGPKWLGPPRHISGLRHQTDLLPTLLNLTKVPWVGDVPGKDLIQSPGHDTVYSSCYWDKSCLVRQQGDTAVIYHYLDRPPEAFDLRKDPLQEKDLAPGLPPETIERAVQDMQAFRASVDYFYANTKHPR